METFNYVIVGAGSAGSVLANRLSEDEKTTVCVLEAGPSDWHPFIHIPAGFMYTLVNPRVNWLYSSEATEWTGGRRIAAPGDMLVRSDQRQIGLVKPPRLRHVENLQRHAARLRHRDDGGAVCLSHP